jgi:hypothetical protein
MTWISPNFQNVDFPGVMSLDQKIEVFADRVKGWQLDMAQLCANGSPHSGFAVLHIVFSYFEMVAKFQAGYTQVGDCEKYFKEGVYSVFPELHNHPSGVGDKVLDSLYEDVRCALYHSGITAPHIVLTGDVDAPIAWSSDGKQVTINPHKLVPGLQQHFRSYIRQLRDHKNDTLRRNFETRFDYQSQ